MQTQNYHEWKETAELLHMLLQMMGKAKLARMPRQPEWGQTLLTMTEDGFTTGLIPSGSEGFTISFSVTAGQMRAACTDGAWAGFALRPGLSVSGYYAEFCAMLEAIGHETTISPVPQECFTQTPFAGQDTPYTYDNAAARRYFEACVFAHNGLLAFASPFRCKKILPSLFWGTFDMTAILFAGEAQPFPGKGVIEKTAFDERLVEFGFWPGDDKTDKPSFFVLAYPFVEKPGESAGVRPQKAWFDSGKKEYFLTLEDLLAEADPAAALQGFCDGAFKALSAEGGWADMEWFRQPLEQG